MDTERIVAATCVLLLVVMHVATSGSAAPGKKKYIRPDRHRLGPQQGTSRPRREVREISVAVEHAV
jgi:hypothetical protein